MHFSHAPAKYTALKPRSWQKQSRAGRTTDIGQHQPTHAPAALLVRGLTRNGSIPPPASGSGCRQLRPPSPQVASECQSKPA